MEFQISMSMTKEELLQELGNNFEIILQADTKDGYLEILNYYDKEIEYRFRLLDGKLAEFECGKELKPIKTQKQSFFQSLRNKFNK